MKVLVVGAHVDDIEGMMGGTLALLVAQAGHEITARVAFSHREGAIFEGKDHGDVRFEEARRSFAHLALPPPTIFENHCGDLSVLYRLRNALVATIEYCKPDAVFTHWPGDLHGDHQVTSFAVKDACWNTKPVRCPELIYCETAPDIFDSKKRAPGGPLISRKDPLPRSLNFNPTHWTDIADTWELKRDLLCEMRSQEGERLWQEHLVKWAERHRRFGHLFDDTFFTEVFTRARPDEPMNPELMEILRPMATDHWWPR